MDATLTMIRANLGIPDDVKGPVLKTLRLSDATAAKVGGSFDMLADQRIYALRFELPCWSFKGKAKDKQQIEELAITLTERVREKDENAPGGRDELLREMNRSGLWKYQGNLCIFTRPGDLTARTPLTSLQLGDVVRLNFTIQATITEKISLRIDPKKVLLIPYHPQET